MPNRWSKSGKQKLIAKKDEYFSQNWRRFHFFPFFSFQFYVFGRHGKTKNLALWSLDALSDSNSNLNEYTAPHRYDEYSFQMPENGIAGENGLKNQCIIINDIKNLDEYFYPDKTK